MKQYNTLDFIVRNLMAKQGETTEHKKWLYLAHAKSFLDTLTVVKPRIAKQVKTVRLTVGSDRTIDYPEDYLDYVKIGVQVGSHVLNFAFNERLANLPPDCCNPSLDPNSFNFNFGLIPSEIFDTQALPCCGEYLGYSFNGAITHIRGYGWGGYYGQFTKSDTCRHFRFAPECHLGPVYLEYVSTNIRSDADTVLDMRVVPVLENYILWQIYLSRGQAGLADRYEAQYNANFYLMHAASDEFSVEQMEAIMDDHYSILPLD